MFLNVPWQTWAILALVVAIALYLVFTDDGLSMYDALESRDDNVPVHMDRTRTNWHTGDRETCRQCNDQVATTSELREPYPVQTDPDPHDPLSSYYRDPLDRRFHGRSDER